MDTNVQSSMQSVNLRNLLVNSAFRFADKTTPWFPYTSGQVGPYYLQSIAVEKDGRAYAAAIQALVNLIRSEAGAFDAISGGETRDWDFSNPVAVALCKPHLKIYKDGKTLGADIAGKTFIHVADLNNEGSSVRDCWKPVIERGGGRLAGVAVFVDRMEDGYTLLKKMGIKLLSVVALDARAWKIVRESGYVTEDLYNQLVARQNNRDAWAEQALLNHPEYFRLFYNNPKTRARADRIIANYTGIGAELKRIAKQQS